MALVVNSRVQETSTNTGTGAMTLTGAVTQFQSFASTIGDGNSTYYMIADQTGTNWEEGLGTFIAANNTLTRAATNVIASSSAGGLVNFTSGTKNIFCTYPAKAATISNPYTYYSSQPTLFLDFVNNKQLDPRITFTRPSTALYYDGKTSTLAEQNLFLYSNGFTNAVWTANNVTITSGVADPLGGTNAYSITANTAGASLYQNLTTPGGTQTLSFWMQGSSGSNTANLISDSSVLSTISLTGTWSRYSFSGTIPGGSGTHNVGIQLVNTSDVINIYAAQLETRSTNTAYIATTGSTISNYIPTLVTAPANVPRFDYSPTTGQSLGLLIEESRTNLIANSTTFAGWSNYNTFIYNANSIIAPDGTQTGATYVSGGSIYRFNIPANNTFYYTLSTYIKPVNPAAPIRLHTDGCSSIGEATIVPSTGVVSVIYSSPTMTSTSVGNGWYRISMTGVAGNNIPTTITNGTPAFASSTNLTTNATPISFTTTGTLPSPLVVGTTYYVANAALSSFNISTTADGANLVSTSGGSGLHKVTYLSGSGFLSISPFFGDPNLYGFWGPQFEAGSFATSYIPTGSSTVTRSADTASITGTNFSSWYNPAQGTYYVETETPQYSLGLGAGLSTIIHHDNSWMRLQANDPGTSTRIQMHSQTVPTPSYGGILLGQYFNANSQLKIASSYSNANNIFYLNINGYSANLTSFGAGSLQSNLARILYIGNNSGTQRYLNAHIRKIVYYPTALSTTNIQALVS